jgi:hypothetical protein
MVWNSTSRNTRDADSLTVVIPNLKRIVNEAWELENFDILKLSRYMRCLFQYTLPHGDSVGEELLDQIYKLAQETAEVIHSSLHFLSIGIDFFYRVNCLTL